MSLSIILLSLAVPLAQAVQPDSGSAATSAEVIVFDKKTDDRIVIGGGGGGGGGIGLLNLPSITMFRHELIVMKTTAIGTTPRQAALLQPCTLVARTRIPEFSGTTEQAVDVVRGLLHRYKQLLNRCMALEAGKKPTINVMIERRDRWGL